MILMSTLLACTNQTTPDPTGDTGTVTDTTPPTDTTTKTPTATSGDTGTIVLKGKVSAALNPDFPTIVLVSWDQPIESTVHLEFRADKGEWMASPATLTPVGPAEATILGVPYDADVDFRLVSDVAFDPALGLDATFSVRTGALPADLIEPDVVVNDPTGWDPASPFLITSLNRDGDSRRGQWWVTIMNRDGRYVWGLEGDPTWVSRHVSLTADGVALLVDRDTYWRGDSRAANATVVRMTLDGTIEHTYATPGLHHAFTPVGGGDIAWAGKPQAGAGYSYETLWRVDEAGKQTEIWNCGTGVSLTSCGSNGLWWDPRNDHLLFSLYSHDTVIDVDIASGTTTAVFGRITGAWTFDPAKSQFWWNHGAIYTDTGTLLVSTRDESDRIDSETYIREYELDWDKEILTEVWNFGIGRGVYATNMGEAYRLANGNSLHVLGSTGRLTEAKPDRTVVWDVDWNPGDASCTSNPVGTDHCKHNGRTTVIGDLYPLLTPAP